MKSLINMPEVTERIPVCLHPLVQTGGTAARFWLHSGAAVVLGLQS